MIQMTEQSFSIALTRLFQHTRQNNLSTTHKLVYIIPRAGNKTLLLSTSKYFLSKLLSIAKRDQNEAGGRRVEIA